MWRGQEWQQTCCLPTMPQTCCVSAARKKTVNLQLSKYVCRWVNSDFFFCGEDRDATSIDACHGCARFRGASCVGLACWRCLAGNERLNLTLLSTDRVTRRNTQIQRRVRAREPGRPVETTRSDRKQTEETEHRERTATYCQHTKPRI